MKPRIVLDTNVLASHFIVPHRNPSKVLNLALSGQLTLVLSPFILGELADFLREKLRFNPEQVSDALDSLKAIAEIVHPHHAVDVIQEDESDNNILECALSGRAHVIVSGDKSHLQPLKEFRGIKIMSPAEFLKRFQ